MNFLDLLILLVLLADIARGARIGFSRQFFSFIGFWGGLLIGALIAPHFTGLAGSPAGKLAIILGVSFVIAGLLGGAGEVLGSTLKHWSNRFNLGPVDSALGGLFGAVLVFISVWIIAGMLFNVPQRSISQQIHQSQFVRLVDSIFPPAPPYIARLQKLIDPNGFPQVFLGQEPTPGTTAGGATIEEVNAVIAADGKSTVKIEGIGCGGEVSGSGFVADDGLVITNAHVVAGIGRPIIFDSAGAHIATTVFFDPNLDVAILRASGLAGKPLPISTDVARSGTHSVALGYPEGGQLTGSGGSVIRSYVATGRNIYDEGITARQIYELGLKVLPGNSGGPLVRPDGTVIGLIFARSQLNDQIGYALTMKPVVDDLHAAGQSRVSTGICAQ